MSETDNLPKLIDARNKMAEVYESLATDQEPDNGNLTELNDAILRVANVIRMLQSNTEEVIN